MKEILLLALAVWLILINLIGAALACIDKRRSKTVLGSKMRIRERTFVRISIIGGGIGVLTAMLLIHHKTRNHNFLLAKIAFFTAIWAVIILLIIKKTPPETSFDLFFSPICGIYY